MVTRLANAAGGWGDDGWARVSETLGLSIRFIQAYDAEADRMPRFTSLWDRAFILAIADEREDRSFADKLSDALTFLKRGIH